ncbi:hypothetical protein LCGC14_2516290 [marine sediment metagenome]|uniref:Uncharacterized protein n=1 Tax=marine sediment metagenome TaxID=412755 RepID=A0A0F9AXN5_9ZZZZ
MKQCKHFQWVNHCVNANREDFIPRCHGDSMLCHLPDEQAKIAPRTVWVMKGGYIVNNRGDRLPFATASRVITGIQIIKKLYNDKCVK